MKNVWEVELLKREEISASLDGKTAYILPIASSEVLGGVQPIQKTEEMNQQVGVDEKGKLWFAKPDVEGFVSFQENQELSDSQKVQARDNINAEGYDWHGLRSLLTNNNIVGFAANSEADGAAVINWPIALNIKSTKSDDYIALYVLLSQVDVITNGSYIDQQLSIIENTIIPEAEALINSGCMSIENGEALWRMYYCIQLGILQKIKKLSIQKDSQGVWYFTGSNGSVMYYNGKLYNNTVKPSYDKTLTIKGTAADAKAVGDALATKLNRDEVLVKSLPILRKEVLAEGTKYEARISYVNVADMEEACLYAMANKEETLYHQIRFVYVCEDSTEKSIVNLSATGICYALHTYVNGLRMATTLWLPNATYLVDLGDSSTADNVVVTGSQPSEYLPVTNRIAYTPTGDYHPATKKYVDDAIKTVDVSEAVFITVEDIDEICSSIVEAELPQSDIEYSE